jgi:hypothetical protein
MAKRHILAAIYACAGWPSRPSCWLPLTPASVYVFSAVMGLLWLSTVPPTNAIVAQIFGVQYMSMLGGFVFLSHQVGSFMGVWLGGKLYDMTGSYDGRVVAGRGPERGRHAGQPAGARRRHRAHGAAGRMKLRPAAGLGRRGAGAGRGVCRLPEPAHGGGPGEPGVVVFLSGRTLGLGAPLGSR